MVSRRPHAQSVRTGATPVRNLRFVALLLAAVATVAVGEDAEQPRPAKRRVVEQLQVPRKTVAPPLLPLPQASREPNERERKVIQRFRESIELLRNGSPAAKRAAQDRVLERRRAAFGGGDSDRLHRAPGLQTPRQIRGNRLSGAAAKSHDLDQASESARTFLRAHRDVLRVRDPDNEFRLRSSERDAHGFTQHRFSQQHRGLEVWPAGLVVQVGRSGEVDLVSGAHVPTPRRVVRRPSVDSRAASAAVLKSFGGDVQPDLTEPELFVYGRNRSRPRLAWRLEATVSDHERWLMIVDAHTSEVLNRISLVMTNDTAGTGNDSLGQQRQVNSWFEGGEYYMADTSKSMFDPTSNPPHPDEMRGGILVTDARNEPVDSFSAYYIKSNSPNSWFPADGVSAAYGLSETYDYFQERHARNSLDGNGGTMFAIVRIGNNYNNAFWNGTFMAFGDGDRYAASLDVVGHELTHGVVERTAGLVYQYQSGALNESFADIFGEMVESRSSSGGHDWLMGTELSSHLRDMQNPNSLNVAPGLPYPKKMSQYIDTSQDNGGVHLNSSIPNHAFYQLAEGLPNAVGLVDAERIFYRTLATKLNAQSQFIDCRIGAIASAEELFGFGSSQALATAAAFDAVEIFGAAPTPAPTPAPQVSGDDSLVFISWDDNQGNFRVARREGNDPAIGVWLSTWDAGWSRPSVTGDGSICAFVDSFDDLCLLETSGANSETCLGLPGTVHSVAMSADGNRYAFVLLDAFGDPENSITLIDLADDTTRTFPLRAPILDGGTVEVVQADVMDFTRDGKGLIYDAFNILNLSDGSTQGVWSIYGLDLETESVFTVIPPSPGLDVGDPALSHNSDRYLAFEAFEGGSGDTTVFAADLFSGEINGIVTVPNTPLLAVPGFTGDDLGIVFTVPDTTPSNASLWHQALGGDHITPSGGTQLYISDGGKGVIYRRGEFQPTPPPESIELALETGAPKIDSLDVDIPTSAGNAAVRLNLAHDVRGKLINGGTCTVAGNPVVVSGSLSYKASRGIWRYNLLLKSTTAGLKVKLKGDVGSAFTKVVYKSPLEKFTNPGQPVAATSTYQPTSRFTIAPNVDFLGRISGTGTILGGFGNDGTSSAFLSGKVRLGKLTLKVTDVLSKRKLKFKGFLNGDAFVGKLNFKILPAKSKVFGYEIPDIFGN